MASMNSRRLCEGWALMTATVATIETFMFGS
jgi:hypothetical protein